MAQTYTTAQVIEKLYVGQKAKPTRNKAPYIYKDESGGIRWHDGDPIQLVGQVMGETWKLLPFNREAPFEEARQAYIAGKTIQCDTLAHVPCIFDPNDCGLASSVTWRQINEGKWSIVESEVD